MAKKAGGTKVGNALRSVGKAVKTFAQTGSLKTALNSTKPALQATANAQQSANISKAGSSSYMKPQKNIFGAPKQGQLDRQVSALRGSSQPAQAAGLNFTPMPGSNLNYTAKPGSSLDFGPKQSVGAIGSSENYSSPLTAGGISQDSYKGAPGTSTTSYSSPNTANAGYTGENKVAKQTAALDAVTMKKEESQDQEEFDYWDREEKKLQRQMERLQQMSQEEQNTQSQIDALSNDERLVEAGLTQQITDVNKEPIPMQYLQGWGTTFNKDANAKFQAIAATRVPLEVRLANLQQRRQASLDVAKQRYENARGRNKEQRQRGYDLTDEARERRQQIEDRNYKGSGSSGFKYSAADQAADSQALENSRGEDGYVDPNVYLTLYKEWVKNGGTITGFKSKYPPKAYVNPANTWMPRYLMPTQTGGREI